MSRRFPASRVAPLLFFSGACALVYQVAWFRELRLIFGASTASSAAVLAIFMGGLGIGGAKLGKRADASPNPLAMYANLELGVAIAAGVTPLFVAIANSGYLALGGTDALGTVGATLARLVLSVLVLGPAVLLMGGTLPAAARAVESEADGARRSVALLYGVNTFGAVLGTLLANFLLLEILGTRLTLWAAALVNVLVAMAGRSLSRGATAAKRASDDEATDEAPSEPVVREAWFPPAAAALIGGAFMLMELTWYRMLAPLLGGSSYTFGLILAVALVGIGIGGAIYARGNVPATLRAFAVTCALEAFFIAVPYAVGDRLALLTATLRPITRMSFGAGVAIWTLIACVVVLPAAIVSGVQFPLVIGLYGRGAKGVGRDVGAAYLANTLGSIGGSLAGGFGLIPLLGAVGSWKLVVLSLVVGATVAAVLDARRGSDVRRLVSGMLFSLVPALPLLATGPTTLWRHGGIGAGRVDGKLEPLSHNSLNGYVHAERRAIQWEEDGTESSVALGWLDGYTFIVNGKSDGHAQIDGPTQVMSGLLAALVHGGPKRALVVGLGTGSTAGWLGKIPSMDRVDVVELEPAILRVAKDCAPVNESVLDNPKVKIHLEDARELLRTTKERYDIIFSEPSNPYRAGISSLYTVDYYRAAAERVADGGLFVQWVQAYEVDGWAVATALVTLRQVFGDVEVWSTMSGDLLLIARREHAPIDVDRIRALLTTEPYNRAAKAVWRTDSAEGVLAHFVARSGLADELAQRGLGAVNTDDQNLLEFAFARSVGQQRRVDNDLANLAVRLEVAMPDVRGPFDPAKVLEERWLFQEAEGTPLMPPPAANAPTRFGPVVSAYRDRRYGAALRLWQQLERPAPRTYGEASMLAELQARAGEPADIARIEGAPAGEREYFLALWHLRHKDPVAAAKALTTCFENARVNPWQRSTLFHGAIDLAIEIAMRDASTREILLDALGQPFAVEAARDPRLVAAARIAELLPDPKACVDALAPLEPPPWDRNVFEVRVRCYEKANHPNRAIAEADMVRMLALDTPIGASIPSPPITARPQAPPDLPPAHPPIGVTAGLEDAGALDAGLHATPSDAGATQVAPHAVPPPPPPAPPSQPATPAQPSQPAPTRPPTEAQDPRSNEADDTQP